MDSVADTETVPGDVPDDHMNAARFQNIETHMKLLGHCLVFSQLVTTNCGFFRSCTKKKQKILAEIAELEALAKKRDRLLMAASSVALKTPSPRVACSTPHNTPNGEASDAASEVEENDMWATLGAVFGWSLYANLKWKNVHYIPTIKHMPSGSPPACFVRSLKKLR